MMGNDLRERLEALAQKSCKFEEEPLSEWLKAREALARELISEFQSNGLVTRQELDEAVAKAVAEEREACASKVANFRAHLNQEALLKLFTDQPLNTKLVENVSKFLDGISAAIRARSEQKEGE